MRRRWLRHVLAAGLVCFAFGQSAFADEDEFETALAELEDIGWSGSSRSVELGAVIREGELGRSSIRDRIRVTLALSPILLREDGYVSARSELVGLLTSAGDDSGSVSQISHLRLGIVELAKADGKWGYAFRQLIEARRLAGKHSDPSDSTRILLSAIELSLDAGMPHVGESLLRHEEQYLTEMNLADRYRLSLLRSQLYFLTGDYVAMSVELERLYSSIGPEMPMETYIRYCNERAWGSMAVDSAAAGRRFLEAAWLRLQGLDNPILAAEVTFTEAVLVFLEGGPVEVIEDKLQSVVSTYRENNRLGHLLGLYQRLLQFPGLEALSSGDGPFLRVLMELPGRGLEPASQALRLLALAELGEEAGLSQAELKAAYRESRQMASEFEQSLVRLCNEWILLSHEQHPFGSTVAFFSGDAYYLWIFLLCLIILLLILTVRFRGQRHINEELQKLVEKAFEAEQAAADSNRMKSQFLANVSHELRAPLSGLVGMSSLLDEIVKDPPVRKCVETIRDCSENLSALMDDLIDLSKIEAGHIEIEKKPFNLFELIDYNFELIRTMAESKDLLLEKRYLSDHLPQTYLGDRVRIGQVLANLLQNAVKFTHAGSVALEVRYESTLADEGTLYLKVVDTGIGIEMSRQRSVFEPFSKGAENEQMGTKGSGLGLAICRRLVELMGGAIALKSTPGKGTSFEVALPLKETDISA